MQISIGDRVTVATSYADHAQITAHPHAIVTGVERERHPDGDRYYVGHPPDPRRWGPYPAARLTPGWVTSR